MNIVFLDMDGVLNNDNFLKLYNEAKISKTNMQFFLNAMRLISKQKEIQIVSSSSWRIFGWDNFQNDVYEFVPEYAKEFLSYFHKDWCTKRHVKSRRSYEVQTWLSEHKNIENYLCVDDSTDYFDDQPLLNTSNDYGFLWREETIMEAHFLGKENVGNTEFQYTTSDSMKYLRKTLVNQEKIIKKIDPQYQICF